MKLVVAPLALAELHDAAAFYALKANAELGLAFVAEFERTAKFVLPILCSVLYFVALVGDISSVDSHTALSVKSPQTSFESLPSHITGGAPATGPIGSSTPLPLRSVTPNRVAATSAAFQLMETLE